MIFHRGSRNSSNSKAWNGHPSIIVEKHVIVTVDSTVSIWANISQKSSPTPHFSLSNLLNYCNAVDLVDLTVKPQYVAKALMKKLSFNRGVRDWQLSQRRTRSRRLSL